MCVNSCSNIVFLITIKPQHEHHSNQKTYNQKNQYTFCVWFFLLNHISIFTVLSTKNIKYSSTRGFYISYYKINLI